MDRLLSYLVRLIVWFSGFMKPLSRLGLCRYDEWHRGQRLKLLLVGYNGARNTGADARVVALVKQLEEVLGADNVEMTVMTLDEKDTKDYFPNHVRQFHFTTVFFLSLLRATSRNHAAILCEGSTLTTTFAKALSVFYCEAAGIMSRQRKPCIAYGSEVGKLDGWLARLCRDLCRDTYFIVRTQESMNHLQALELKGHVGTDTAWTFQTPEGEAWADRQLRLDGWDGRKPLMGVAVINPFCWPVYPSLWRWAKAVLTGNHSQQYDKMYFFSDSMERRQQFKQYLDEVARAVNRYSHEHDAFVVILGMERLDAEACQLLAKQTEQPHAVYTSDHHDVFQMTGLLRQLSTLITSRYHAAVLSMARAIPLVAISMDGRLDGVISETELDENYLHHVTDAGLGEAIMASLQMADNHRDEIAGRIQRHQTDYESKVQEMSLFFVSWLKTHFS